jgi:CheY-like chemotaxis protein
MRETMSNTNTAERSVTIVAAEDDDGHAMLIERNLRRAGLTNGYVRLRDGQETLDYFRSEGDFVGRPPECPCVLLLDIKMPRVDGIEVLRLLKSDPRTASTPVVMLTTTDDPRDIQRCYDLGCNVYITKPVSYEPFIEAVRRLGFFLQIVQLPPGSLAR